VQHFTQHLAAIQAAHCQAGALGAAVFDHGNPLVS
jgi:hypothetical protein